MSDLTPPRPVQRLSFLPDADAEAAVLAALKVIARGNTKGGGPLGGEMVRQLARTALVTAGLSW